MLDQRQRLARFGPFELDERSGELRRSGIRIPLQEQPLQILLALLASPGEVVMRDDLRQKLWPADTFVDFDHGLNAAIRKLRSSLDDSATTPRFVETVARHGYRFIAPVEWIDLAEQRQSGRVARPNTIRWAAAATAIAILAVTGWLVFRAFAIPNGIAVLPFAADRNSDYVAEGVAQSLISRLSQLKDVRVMSWSSVTRYRQTPPDLKRVSSDLHVRAVVNGALRQQGSVSRITVELIDTADGSQLWGNSYESAGNLASVQHQIAVDLARHVSRHPESLRREKHTPPPEAHDLYLQGLYLFNKRGCSNCKRAAELFEAAIARDPKFAEAHAGVANAVGSMAGSACIPAAEGQQRAKAAADRALSLDDSLAEAWASQAAAKANYYWDFAGAETDFKRAISLNPGYATAHLWYGGLLRMLGRDEEARRETEIGYNLDPLSGTAIYHMECSLYIDGKYDELVALNRRAGAIDKQLVSRYWSVQSYLVRGMFEEALERNVNDEAYPPQWRPAAENAIRTHTCRAYYEGVAAKMAAAASGAARTRRYFSPMDPARMYAALGKREETLQWLNQSYEVRAPGLTYFYTDPVFRFLRSDPRATELARKIGLPQVK